MSFLAVGISAGAGLVQTAVGAIGQGKANKKLDRLFKQRKSFETPKEIFDILQATQFNAQSGFGSQTLDFLTNQADRSFATSTGTALRLGADPNVISQLDDQYLQNIFKIGSDDAMLRFQNFDKFLNAKQLVAANKEAEWASQQDILKDQMAAAGMQAQAGAQNVSSGLNLTSQALSNWASAALYDKYGYTGKKEKTKTIAGGSTP